MFKFNCPLCQKPITGTDELVGQSVQCPFCRNSITVPPSSHGRPCGIAEDWVVDRSTRYKRKILDTIGFLLLVPLSAVLFQKAADHLDIYKFTPWPFWFKVAAVASGIVGGILWEWSHILKETSPKAPKQAAPHKTLDL